MGCLSFFGDGARMPWPVWEKVVSRFGYKLLLPVDFIALKSKIRVKKGGKVHLSAQIT